MKIISRTTRKINGNWYARVRYEDDNGKKGELLRGADGKSDAENLKAKLVTELLEKGHRNSSPVKLHLGSLFNMPKTTFTCPPSLTRTARESKE